MMQRAFRTDHKRIKETFLSTKSRKEGYTILAVISHRIFPIARITKP